MPSGVAREYGIPAARLREAISVLLVVVAIGTVGYRLIQGWSWLDSLYMTVITLATVGFRETGPLTTAGQVFTIGLITVGIATGAWALSAAVDLLIGEDLSGAVARRRMQREIDRLRNHYVICGFGRMGKEIASDLARRKLPIVVVEDNPEQIPLLQSTGYPFVEGDATSDLVLRAAGVERAKGLVAVAASDPVNVFIVLTARGLNPKLYIVARSVLLENEEKLRRAGADRVVSPYVIGGHRMAAAVLHPAVADFLEMTMHGDGLQLELADARVAASSPIAGRTLAESGIRSAYGVNVVAIRKTGRTLVQPTPDTTIAPDDTLIVVGTQQQIDDFVRVAMGGEAS